MRYMTRKNRFLKHLPILPFITLAVIPILVLDFWTELYHRISFPIYGIPVLKRKEYIRIDRHRLKYLTLIQKYYCVYCGYANGIVRYWVKLFAETEAYWCGIQHRHDSDFQEPEHHVNFVPYDDEEAFRKTYTDNKQPHF